MPGENDTTTDFEPGAPTPDDPGTPYSVYFYPEHLMALRQRAKERERSVSFIIRELVEHEFGITS